MNRVEIEDGRLLAQDLSDDGRVAQALELMMGALQERQATLRGVRPPNPALQRSYAELLSRFDELRGGPLFYRYLGSGFGAGPLVELADGSVKYDLIAGMGVHFMGHGHPALVRAELGAALRDTIMQGNLQQNVESADLSERLLAAARAAGTAVDSAFVTTSGAMANENALKIAFQKKHPADRVLAFERCFAGRTLALSQITDKPGFREGLPRTLAVDHVPFYDPGRPDSIEHSLGRLREHLARHPGGHAAMVLELVQGEGGFNAGSPEFFQAIAEELRSAGVLVILDEIQTFGRTLSMFACEHFGVAEYADLITIGKLTQVCATLYRGDLRPRPGLLSQTFTGSTSAIHAGIAILDELSDGGYYGPGGKIARLQNRFRELIADLCARFPRSVRGPWGLGAMAAFEVFGGDPQRTRQFIRDLFERGVIAFLAGSNPMRVRFLLPAGALSIEQLEDAMAIVADLVEEGA